MKNKLLLVLGILAVTLFSFWYFLYFSIDATTAKKVIEDAGKRIKPTMGDKFLIAWARGLRLSWLFKTFEYEGKRYVTDTGAMEGVDTGFYGELVKPKDAIASDKETNPLSKRF